MRDRKITIVGLGSSLLAGLGIVSCCGTPIFASIVSFVGIGASQLEFFSKYQPFFLFLALLSLLIGFYQMYFKKKNTSCCSTTSESENGLVSARGKSKSVISKIVLWVTAILIGYLLIFNQAGGNSIKEQDGNCCGLEGENSKSHCYSEDK